MDILDIAITIVVFFFFLSVFSNVFKKDDSDSEDERSNLTVYTDHATQLQYLSSWSGAITPRMNPDGTHRHTADSSVRHD